MANQPALADYWTRRDDATIKVLYPDYKSLLLNFPHRSLYALKHRARRIGVANKRHDWTQIEVARLKRMYGAKVPPTPEELRRAFPNMTIFQIRSKATHVGAPRPRKAPVMLDIPVLDAIRQRAHAECMSMVDLDVVAGTKRYFQSCPTRLNWKHLAAGTLALGGHLMPLWDEDCEVEASPQRLHG